jgi:hypothetical protein
MKKIILIVFVMSFANILKAQDFIDNALLFSRVRPGGSARIQAIGGAQVSLGGDFSSALSNPAGLGMYNRSEFTISPAINFSNATSDYFGTSTKDSKSVLNIPGISLVLRKESGKDTGFLGGSIGISFSRINDFHQNYTASGDNPQSSIIDYFLQDANNPYGDGTILDPAELTFGGNDFYNLTALAFNNFLIDTVRDSGNQLYYDSPLKTFSDDPTDIRHVHQVETSQRKGVINQWSIAYGANFSDKFFIGANIGITSLRYKLKQTFQESDYSFELDPDYKPLDNMLIEESYDISGSGVNLALGMIYRPINYLQLGVSLVTPTYYQLTDAYSARISTQWNSFDYYGDGSNILRDVNEEFDEPVLSDYNLITPMRITTGATFITKSGFISGDIEFVNYSKPHYAAKGDNFDFDVENHDIKATYKSVVNYRLGGEYRFGKYRARLGYNFMADPYLQEGIKKKSINTYSTGIGYRAKDFFIDLAVIHSRTNGTRRPYFVDGPDPVALQKFTNTNFIITVGFPF